MDHSVDRRDELSAELARLRHQNAELLAALGTRFGLVWEKDALGAEKDLAKSFLADLIVEEDGAPVSMLENNPGNVVIEGNNIGALKVLRRTHSGAFDCILIDPPYGTGNTTWQYNDDFVNSKHRFRERLALMDGASPGNCPRPAITGRLLACLHRRFEASGP